MLTKQLSETDNHTAQYTAMSGIRQIGRKTNAKIKDAEKLTLIGQ